MSVIEAKVAVNSLLIVRIGLEIKLDCSFQQKFT